MVFDFACQSSYASLLVKHVGMPPCLQYPRSASPHFIQRRVEGRRSVLCHPEAQQNATLQTHVEACRRATWTA